MSKYSTPIKTLKVANAILWPLVIIPLQVRAGIRFPASRGTSFTFAAYNVSCLAVVTLHALDGIATARELKAIAERSAAREAQDKAARESVARRAREDAMYGR